MFVLVGESKLDVVGHTPQEPDAGMTAVRDQTEVVQKVSPAANDESVVISRKASSSVL